MGKNLVLKTTKRETRGKKEAAKMRKQDLVPAIIYGHKKEAVAVSVNRHDFTEGLHHGHRLIDMQIGRKKETVIVKDLQYDYLGKDIIHADLMRVSTTETIKVNVQIELKGTAKGTHQGGIVEMLLDHLEVECKVTDMPEKIVVRVDDLDVGDSLHAGDIELPPGLKLFTAAEAVVLTCHLVAAAKTAEQAETEEPIAPEVIGEEQKETEQDKETES